MAHRTIRQGQVVVPFGVGAILDIGAESFVVADITRWDQRGLRRVDGSHLERKLKLHIKAPAARDGAMPVAVHRFPRWHFCPRCRAMRFVTGAEDMHNDYQIPRCANRGCGDTKLTPMGFVAACKNGHLSDVDWYWWVHRSTDRRNQTCSPQGARMYFETTGQGGGDWSAISLRCSCGAKQNFVGLVQVEGPAGMKCKGGQPWELHPDGCGDPLFVFRRAASNLHFPKSLSALDLVPDVTVGVPDLSATWQVNPSWSTIESLRGAGIEAPVILDAVRDYADRIADQNGCTPEAALDALAALLRDDAPPVPTVLDGGDPQVEILREEWSALSGRRDVTTPILDIKRQVIPDVWPPGLRNTITAVSVVRRLREVRALLGFQRLAPEKERPLVPVDLGKRLDWRPGVEAWGEGIFIEINAKVVRAWEARSRAAAPARQRWLAAAVAGLGWDAGMAGPRFILLHSLAHALIRRLGFDAGYSASSLRERVYSCGGANEMAGVLIYTADGDSEGSLGGLARMGQPRRLGAVLQAALMDAAWCSADPVCKESDRIGINGMNAASCHACMLTSETSCLYNNSLLDRRCLIDISEMPAFFDLAAISADATEARH